MILKMKCATDLSNIFANNVIVDFKSIDESFTLAGTVPTGFEFIAKDEIEDKLGLSNVITGQGKVYFQASYCAFSKIHTLRSIERLFIVLQTFRNYVYNENNDLALMDLKNLAACISWNEVTKVWVENCKHQKVIYKQKLSNSQKKKHGDIVNMQEEFPLSKNNSNFVHKLLNEKNPNNLVEFRTTANRIGKQQSITSPEAEQHFGGALQDLTNWKVELTFYNLEVLLTLGADFVMVSLSLTHESLHRRNIVDFGMTTLKASIAYSMARMCKILPGDIVIDPMCGSGSIPVESVQEWGNSFHFCGDKSSSILSKSLNNVKNINYSDYSSNKFKQVIKYPIDILRWDVTKLPLSSEKIDVIVTDIPFGKRSGTKVDNRSLYPAMLKEMARVCKQKTGRACILTNDKRSFVIGLQIVSNLWKLKRNVSINVGGLRAVVYLLKRTDVNL